MKIRFLTLLLLAILLMSICACTAPWTTTQSGVYEGPFADNTTLRVISGIPHNQGWYDKVILQYADGSEQVALMSRGEGFFHIYAWRDVIDINYMTLLYSGKYAYNYPSLSTLTMTLDNGDAYKLTKTDQDPLTYSFEAKSPDAKFYDDPQAPKYSTEQIASLKSVAETQKFTFSQFIQQYDAEQIVWENNSYVVRLTLQDGSYVYAHFDQSSLVLTQVTDHDLSKSPTVQ